jgi:NADH-quinone oxidoreductase subunit E
VPVAVTRAWWGAKLQRTRVRGGSRMSELLEPLPSTPNGHAGGDVASEELVGHGHFVTHFDEPSLDYGVTETKITEATVEELRSIAGRYPQARSALLPMLHLVQSVEGRVTPAGIEACAEILGLTAADVSGVATFYTMYKRRPVGEYHVGVCTTALCAIMGGDKVYAKLQDHLGIGNDETTADGKITLEHVECNAACDFAPVMMVNWEFFDNTTPEKAIEVVDQLRAAAHPWRPSLYLEGSRAGARWFSRRSCRRRSYCCRALAARLAHC